MPKSKRTKPLYQRGEFKLYRRQPRAGERPSDGILEIIWYDNDRRRERSASTGTSDLPAGKRQLDKKYLELTNGDAFCPTCGQPRQAQGILVVTAIADYLTMAEEKPSYDSIKPRLAHVLTYLAETQQVSVRCSQVDSAWVERFRKWLQARPIVSPSGAKRERAPSSVENSVLQLSAAISDKGGIKPLFKALQPREVNRTPTYRADIATLARMFRYCIYPDGRSDKEIARRKRERAHLLAFLRISVVTMARPDAAHDVSTAPERRQWHPEQRVLDLNPFRRRQTRKFRAVLPIAHQMVPILNDCDGMLIPIASVENAWTSMEEKLELPRDGQSGMKLIRRSVAHIARSRLPEEAWGELAMFLGHDRFEETSDIYAPFSPTYLRRVLPVIEEIVDEVEAACPGAFYRAVTAGNSKVVALGAAKNG